MLRAEIASGTLGSTGGTGSTGLGTLVEAPVRVDVDGGVPTPAPSGAARALLPAAVVASAAAAGVHAAVAPPHLGHQATIGLFFVAAATFQVGWAGSLVLRAPRSALVTGASVNAAFIALWALTRTVGLPVLMPQPEAVGAWDVTCVAWELVVVAVCLRLLGSGRATRRPAPWHQWDGRVLAFAIGSAAVLAALSVGDLSG